MADIKKTKYLGILCTSTPYASYRDQMCELIRYVHIEGDMVEVKKSFWYFWMDCCWSYRSCLETTGSLFHKSLLWSAVSECCICGQFTVESIKKSKRSITGFISASWKLFFEICGICSFGNISSCVMFSGPLEKFYSFFLVSPHHWKKHRKSFLDKMECSLWS